MTDRHAWGPWPHRPLGHDVRPVGRWPTEDDMARCGGQVVLSPNDPTPQRVIDMPGDVPRVWWLAAQITPHEPSLWLSSVIRLELAVGAGRVSLDSYEILSLFPNPAPTQVIFGLGIYPGTSLRVDARVVPQGPLDQTSWTVRVIAAPFGW